ncbi:hypothetical protein BH09SUM1_BH09SUM1_08690 [soil metagenome]
MTTADAPEAHSPDTGVVATEGAHGVVVEHTSAPGMAAEHVAGEGHGRPHLSHPPEPPHLIEIWYELTEVPEGAEGHAATPSPSAKFAETLHVGDLQKAVPLVGYAPWENHVYFGLAALIVIAIANVLSGAVRKNRRDAIRRPSRTVAIGEFLIGGFSDFVEGVLGKQNGRKYLPFLVTLFYMILACNLMGLVPGLRAPTASIIITGSFALCTFIVVQATAWTRLGPVTYVHHLAGSPKDAIGWCLAPLFLILEIISDFLAKPVSLSLRLMGNILGKDILLGAFMGMGISIVGLLSTDLSHYIGLPLTIPFYFLGLLLSTIQALVFSLLTMIYLTMVLPHDHDHDHNDHYNYELVGHHDGIDEEEEHSFDHSAAPAGKGHHGHQDPKAKRKAVHEPLPT